MESFRKKVDVLFFSKSFVNGIKRGLGVPALGLGSSMFAFGVYLNSAGFSFWHSFSSTFFAFALPGQLVMAETLLAGGTLINVFLAVLFTNARLFPMTVTLIPIIKHSRYRRWKYYIICHFIAVTSWFNMIEMYKDIKKNYRFDYFFGLGSFLWINSLIFTLLGYFCSSYVPPELLIGMVFLNPMYFLVMTIGNLYEKQLILTVLLASIISPFFHLLFQDWGVMLSGVLSGSIGFLVFRDKS